MTDKKDNIEEVTDVEIIEPQPEPLPEKKKKRKKPSETPVDKPLTYQQEAFVQALVSGLSNSEAYIKAYPKAANWTPNSVSVEACKLLRKPNVKARYELLQAEYLSVVTQQSFYDRDQLLNDFVYLRDEAQKSIEQFGVRQANSNAYVNALKNIGDLLGLYPDKRLDINATVSNDFEINIFNDADDETKDKHR
jgi:hypothetical protein